MKKPMTYLESIRFQLKRVARLKRMIDMQEKKMRREMARVLNRRKAKK
jgi:transcriptional antiterminator